MPLVVRPDASFASLCFIYLDIYRKRNFCMVHKTKFCKDSSFYKLCGGSNVTCMQNDIHTATTIQTPSVKLCSQAIDIDTNSELHTSFKCTENVTARRVSAVCGLSGTPPPPIPPTLANIENKSTNFVFDDFSPANQMEMYQC